LLDIHLIEYKSTILLANAVSVKHTMSF